MTKKNYIYQIISARKIIAGHETEKYNIYEKQRSLDKERVKEIAHFYHEQRFHCSSIPFRGCLIYCALPAPEIKYYLIDGQHRFFAIKSLIEKKIIPDAEICVQIINVNSNEEIHQEFVNINLSVPVPLSYIKPETILENAITRLKKMYKKGFSVNPRSPRPRINEDKFKSALIKFELVKKCGYDLEKVTKTLIDLNYYYKELGYFELANRIAGRNKKERSTVSRLYEKVFKTNDYMFIGIFKKKNWLDDINI